jgi:hypothetical protein
VEVDSAGGNSLDRQTGSFHWRGGFVRPSYRRCFLIHSRTWLLGVPAGLVLMLLLIAALPFKREVTPQQWAEDLEKHLLGTDGRWGWDDATSVRLADEDIEKLQHRLIPRFDMLDTPEKGEEFRQITGALKRGELP